MRKPGLIGACWPEPLQAEVLQAAVLEPAAGAAAWDRVRAQIELDDVWDPAIHRLLPLVYANLRKAEVASPDLPRLKGIYRRTWYENQMAIQRVRPALDALQEAGIPLLFLKGVPLALTYYHDLGLRPMADVDLLVPRSQADRALDLLEAQGWVDNARLTRAQLWRTYHGSGMSHPDGGQIDVHWHLGTPLLLPHDELASNDDFWAAAVPFEQPALGLSGVTLAPSDMLLHVIAHGLWAGSASTVRWASDAMAILTTHEVDWHRVTDQATRRRIAPLLGDALRYLVDELHAPVPEPVIDGLRSVSSTRRERRLLRALAGPVEGPALLGGLPHLRSYWAYTRLKWGPVQAARELPGFVAELWQLDNPWQLPAGALRRARRQLTDRAPRPGPVIRERPTISVVVPTHLRPEHLARCLDALAAQEDPPEEVIVVRGVGDVGAAEVLARHRDLSIDLVAAGTTQVERLHAGSARATGSVVAFTDDDAAPYPHWVGRIREHLTDPSIGAVGGRDLQPDSTARPTRRIGALAFGGRVIGGHSDGEGAPRDVEHLRGVNMAFRRSLLRFPAGLRGPGAQGYNEIPLCLAVAQAGRRVVYDPGLLVDHHVAMRFEHGDGDRIHASTAKRVDDAFNQSYVLLSMHARRRWARLAYVLLMGDRSTGGLVRCTVAGLGGDRRLARELVPLLRAHRDAWQESRRRPLRGIAPDEPFPPG